MASFQMLAERSNNVFDTNQSIKAVKLGLNLRSSRKYGETFWHDFIKIMSGDADAMASLLGVDRNTIAEWPSKIKDLLDQITEEDSDNKKYKRSNMILTGDKNAK